VSLRADLLAGRRVAVAGEVEPIAACLGAFGAQLCPLPEPPPEDAGPADAELIAWCGAQRPLHGLVVVAASAAAGPAAADPAAPAPTADPTAITGPLADAWRAIHAVAVEALIPDGAGGRIVLIGPARANPAATPPVTAGLENLARTLSVEWARFGITAVCLDPGPDSGSAQVAELAAFVLSRAGGYLSGCRLRLGSVPVAPRPLI
jgi:NAD(P)-dependent dehydrogenase (short-subunit alcohol dehydrogenase family)